MYILFKDIYDDNFIVNSFAASLGVMPPGMLPRMGMMPQMMVQGGMPPPQMSGMPPVVPSVSMTMSTGIPPVPGQAGMIPLPAGMPPGGMPQVVSLVLENIISCLFIFLKMS